MAKALCHDEHIQLAFDDGIMLVADDVWDDMHLKPFLRGGTRCARLVTTRNEVVLPANALSLMVDAIQPDEAVQLLGVGLGSGSLEQDGPASIVAMKKEEQACGRSITTDFEKDNVMRTKRASGSRSVLFQRSTWAVSPVSRAHGCVLLVRDHRLVGCPEVCEAMSLTVG